MLMERSQTDLLNELSLIKSADGQKIYERFKNKAMKTTLDFGKQYANGKASRRLTQRAIVYKISLKTQMLRVFQKLGYDSNVGSWQTICRWKGLNQTYPTSYH